MHQQRDSARMDRTRSGMLFIGNSLRYQRSMNRVISFSQGIVNRFLLGTVAEAVTFICKKTECEGTLALRIPLTRPNFGLERTQEVQEVLLLRCRKRIEVAHHC